MDNYFLIKTSCAKHPKFFFLDFFSRGRERELSILENRIGVGSDFRDFSKVLVMMILLPEKTGSRAPLLNSILRGRIHVGSDLEDFWNRGPSFRPETEQEETCYSSQCLPSGNTEQQHINAEKYSF